MKKTSINIAAFAAMLMLGGSLAPATTADASTKYRRTKIVKVKHTKYKVRNKKGKTYKFKGSSKKLTLKANHYLKNYTKSTWKRTKQTKVYRVGKKKVVYYYVTTSKHKAAGWVKKSDLKVKSAKKAKTINNDNNSKPKNNKTQAKSQLKKDFDARVGTGSAGGGPMPSVW
ncbi:hypothetical protein [Levilactobacillus lindianensis]|uniref:hypothetical protein n=1 Tax=Levilactobacillus lindianensis TaxID=2486018 RepID=UPI000F749A84|nr:hypothetical protein [Levilactobacillus lindianensis]